MSAPVVMDLGHLSHYTDGPRSTIWWGFAGMIAIETTVFASFIASYFYLRSGAPVWPPGAIEAPELLLPTINTVVLVLSSLGVFMADRAITHSRRGQVGPWLLASMLMGLLFLALKVVEYRDVPHPWHESAYGSITWTIIGFHSAHVVALLLKTSVVTWLAFRGYFNTERRIGITANGLYWHFVVIVWIPLYITLYWVPRL